MPDLGKISGECLCGAVRITVSSPAGWVGACHCRICQQWSGGLWAGFPASKASIEVNGPVKTYASSAIANRGFCAECGTQLWMRDIKDGSNYDLMPGIFEAAKDWPLKSEVYHDQAMQAFALKGDHPTTSAATYLAKNPDAGKV